MSALKGVINQAYENDFKTQVSNNDISLTQVKSENGEESKSNVEREIGIGGSEVEEESEPYRGEHTGEHTDEEHTGEGHTGAAEHTAGRHKARACKQQALEASGGRRQEDSVGITVVATMSGLRPSLSFQSCLFAGLLACLQACLVCVFGLVCWMCVVFVSPFDFEFKS